MLVVILLLCYYWINGILKQNLTTIWMVKAIQMWLTMFGERLINVTRCRNSLTIHITLNVINHDFLVFKYTRYQLIIQVVFKYII